MNRKTISDAVSNISDRHIEEAADFKAKKRKRVWVKWGALAACLCLVSVVCIFTIPHLSRQNTYSEIKLFSMDNKLVFSDIEGEQTFVYDPDSKTMDVLLEEAVTELCELENIIYYSTEDGLFALDPATKGKERIADRAYELTPYQDSLFFLNYSQKDIINENNEHNIIGAEKNLVLYQYNTKSHELIELKKDYEKADYTSSPRTYRDIYLRDMIVVEMGIFYWNVPNMSEKQANVYRISPNGNTNVVYSAPVQQLRLFEGENGIYLVEYGSDKNGFSQFTFKHLSYDGTITWEYKQEAKNYDFTMLTYDPNMNYFFTFSNNEKSIVAFSPNDPEDVQTYQMPVSESAGIFNLLCVGNSLYLSSYSSYDSLWPGKNDFSIYRLELADDTNWEKLTLR